MSVRVDLLDPSLAFGFYCRSREDLADFQEQTATLTAELSAVGQRVPFSVSPTAPAYIRAELAEQRATGSKQGAAQEIGEGTTPSAKAGKAASPPEAPGDEPAADFKTLSGVKLAQEGTRAAMAPQPQMIRSTTREKERCENAKGDGSDAAVAAVEAGGGGDESAGGDDFGDADDDEWEMM
jgi:hypothetical protein